MNCINIPETCDVLVARIASGVSTVYRSASSPVHYLVIDVKRERGEVPCGLNACATMWHNATLDDKVSD